MREGRCADFSWDPTAGQQHSWWGDQILSLCKALNLPGFSVLAVPISCLWASEPHVSKASLCRWNHVLKAAWKHEVVPQLPVPTGGAGVPVASLLLSSALLDMAGLEVKAFCLGLPIRQGLMVVWLIPSQLKHFFFTMSLKYQNEQYSESTNSSGQNILDGFTEKL